MRLKLLWNRAVVFASVMVMAAIIARGKLHTSIAGRKAIENKRKKAAKPAVFTTVAINVVIRLGLPVYTSGAQK